MPAAASRARLWVLPSLLRPFEYRVGLALTVRRQRRAPVTQYGGRFAAGQGGKQEDCLRGEGGRLAEQAASQRRPHAQPSPEESEGHPQFGAGNERRQ